MTDTMIAIEPWLDAELDRMWLIAEHRLRRMQQKGIPFPDNLGMHALESVLAIRRKNRGGGEVADVAELERALSARAQKVASLREAAPIGYLARRLQLRPIEVDVLVATLAPLIDPPLAELYVLVRSIARRGVDLALIGELFELD